MIEAAAARRDVERRRVVCHSELTAERAMQVRALMAAGLFAGPIGAETRLLAEVIAANLAAGYPTLVLGAAGYIDITPAGVQAVRARVPVGPGGRSDAAPPAPDPEARGLVWADCDECGGDGVLTLDVDTIDDPINMCDWGTGGELGEIVTCPSCRGAGGQWVKP